MFAVIFLRLFGYVEQACNLVTNAALEGIKLVEAAKVLEHRVKALSVKDGELDLRAQAFAFHEEQGLVDSGVQPDVFCEDLGAARSALVSELDLPASLVVPAADVPDVISLELGHITPPLRECRDATASAFF